jgi:hypothetical protein
LFLALTNSSLRAGAGKTTHLDSNMLPHGYVNIDWAEKRDNTLKPLTGPKKAHYKTAWELDLFPRIANLDRNDLQGDLQIERQTPLVAWV